jgi:branched-subunit amino acid transport protein
VEVAQTTSFYSYDDNVENTMKNSSLILLTALLIPEMLTQQGRR